MNPEAHLIVRGFVQGVFYRSEAREKARELKITGWIKNENDGSIKIRAQGSKENLEKFIQWCRSGPPEARVEKVDVEFNSNHTESFNDFEIK